MIVEDEVLINQYGQNLLSLEELINSCFRKKSIEQKRNYLNEVLTLIIQSKPIVEDIPLAIKLSQLKATYTPCVLLKKGITYSNLFKMTNLPINEIDKVAILFFSLFKIAYRRRFLQETGTTDKWWYKDLSGSIEDIKKNLIE